MIFLIPLQKVAQVGYIYLYIYLYTHTLFKIFASGLCDLIYLWRFLFPCWFFFSLYFQSTVSSPLCYIHSDRITICIKFSCKTSGLPWVLGTYHPHFDLSKLASCTISCQTWVSWDLSLNVCVIIPSPCNEILASQLAGMFSPSLFLYEPILMRSIFIFFEVMTLGNRSAEIIQANYHVRILSRSIW